MALSINNSSSRLLNSNTIVGGDFSVSLWFNRAAGGAPNDELLFGLRETGTNDYMDIIINSSRNVVAREDGVTAQSFGTITDGTWNHVVANFNTNVSRGVSLNNEPFSVTVGSTGGDPFTSIEEMAIGFNSGTPTSNPFVGLVTLVGVWNPFATIFDITQQEAGSLSAGFSPFLVKNFNIIRYYQILNIDTLNDVLGNDSFTISGSVTNIDGPPLYI